MIFKTVVPGFEFTDHDFLSRDKFQELLSDTESRELAWLLGHGAEGVQ